jgi:hypothetical protein
VLRLLLLRWLLPAYQQMSSHSVRKVFLASELGY